MIHTLRLYYKFKVLVQDGAAQKYCLSIKGMVAQDFVSNVEMQSA